MAQLKMNMHRLQLLSVLCVLLAPQQIGFAQQIKKIPVAVSHKGTDEVGRSVADALEGAIAASQRFLLIKSNTPRPRIIVNLDSVEALGAPQLQGLVSAIGISIIYYRTGIAGVGV